MDEILSLLPQALLPLVSDPEQSDALGINSKNFRLCTSQGFFLLKRWSDEAATADINRTLSIMAWLATQQLPVPSPLALEAKSCVLSLSSGRWSLFPFVEGAYFSGAGSELHAAAEVSGRLMNTLLLLPSASVPSGGPAQMTMADGALLGRVENLSKTWDLLFGVEYAEMLASSWSLLVSEWQYLKAATLPTSRTQAAHFDLHPHNLLVGSGTVAAILDFEACKVMPVGYALGFAALKQCRQAMTLHSKVDPRLIGLQYVGNLLHVCPREREWATHLGDFAVAEVLRRICSILRLNIENRDTRWNKVLGVQLGHLSEARALFG